MLAGRMKFNIPVLPFGCTLESHGVLVLVFAVGPCWGACEGHLLPHCEAALD